MNSLVNLRQKASAVILALLWLDNLLLLVRNLVREDGFSIVSMGAGLIIGIAATATWMSDRIGPTTRIVTSMAHAAMVALLVYAFSGSPLQIDIHMYFFASLAICAFWIDWTAIIAYSALVAVHHAGLYFVLPAAVFPGESDFSRVVLHAVVLILQSGILIAITYSIVGAFRSSDEAVAAAVASEHKAREMDALARSAEEEATRERSLRESEKAEQSARVQEAVARLGKALAALSSGDLSHRIHETFLGDLDGIRLSFNQSVENLETAVGQASSMAQIIRGGANQIDQANGDLSTRTERQAAFVEETASTLGEMTETLRSTADTARAIGDKVSSTREEAERSGSIVADAVNAMRLIEQSSREMSQIISVIDEIAFQTNLLALNAGVEAARAGDAGKGFAVVAQEVRELAQRSANAAKEIKTLINTSSQQVDAGVTFVDRAGEALHRIASEVNTISTEIEDIVKNTSGQAHGIKEIDSAITEIDRSTQHNAAMAEETAAAISSLASEAIQLEDLMRRFQLSAASGAAQSYRAA